MKDLATIGSVLAALESICPTSFAFEDDHVGLHVGTLGATVTSAVVALDWSDELLDFAESVKANLLVCHHPLIWNPLTALTGADPVARFALNLARHNIGFIAAHTNWDCAAGGINDSLALKLGLEDVVPFGESAPVYESKLTFLCPPENADMLMQALADIGLGTISTYTRCAFFVEGLGTFCAPLESKPYVGEPGLVNEVHEVQVQMVCPNHLVEQAVAILLQLHPYETVAYDIVPMRQRSGQPIGRVGTLPNGMTLAEWTKSVDDQLLTRTLAWGDPTKYIQKVAVIGGGADSHWRSAAALGADAFLTGDVRQNHALEAQQAGIAMIGAGHYATEQPGCVALCDRLRHALPHVQWELFTPPKGRAGRPF